MEPFKITVTDVKKPEYVQSCRQFTGRVYRIMAVAMVLLCGVIILARGRFTLVAIIVPVVIFLLIVVLAEIWTQHSYRDNIQQLDNLHYEFGPKHWAIYAGDAHREFDWFATPKLVKTKDCLFVYHESNRSNLIPRRLLTLEQEAQIMKWYHDSREPAKDYQRKQSAEEKSKRRGSGGGRNFFHM